MFKLKNAVSFAGAVSIASLSAAQAEEQAVAGDGLSASEEFLELSEKPLTASQLSEARGSGFPVGGLIFNINVVVSPPAIDPIPDNGLFGDEGVFGEDGVFGEEGGPIGDDGVFGEGGVFGDPVEQPESADSAVAATPGPGNAATPAQEAANPNSAVSTPQAATGGTQAQSPAETGTSNSSNPPAETETQSANANTPAPVSDSPPPAAQTTPPQSEQSASTQPPPETPVETAAEPSPASSGEGENINASGVATGEGSATTIAAASNDNGGASSADSNEGTDGANDSPPPSQTPDPGTPPADPATQSAVSTEEDTSDLTTSEPADMETGLSFSLEEVSDPEVIQRIGPEGLLTILNNTLDNQRITTRVDITIEVPNFTSAMNITKASNLASRTFTQNVFLGGFR